MRGAWWVFVAAVVGGTGVVLLVADIRYRR
jgi:hypothetical protein